MEDITEKKPKFESDKDLLMFALKKNKRLQIISDEEDNTTSNLKRVKTENLKKQSPKNIHKQNKENNSQIIDENKNSIQWKGKLILNKFIETL